MKYQEQLGMIQRNTPHWWTALTQREKTLMGMHMYTSLASLLQIYSLDFPLAQYHC